MLNLTPNKPGVYKLHGILTKVLEKDEVLVADLGDDILKPIDEFAPIEWGIIPENPLSYEEIEKRMVRVDGQIICKYCGKPFWQHPYSLEAVDQYGQPYLHTLCNGRLGKFG